MNDKKKRVLTAASIVVLLGGLGSLMAYLIAIDGTPNKVKIGKGDADIVETFEPPKKLSTDANIYQKLVTVRNEGKNPSFVRVFMDFTDASVKESQGITTYFFVPDDPNNPPADAPSKDAPTGGTWVKASEWSPTGDWVYLDEGGLGGYYYYTKPVEPGSSTPPLISWVRTDFQDESSITDYQILVYSETVQNVEIDENGTVYNETNYQTAWQNYLRVAPWTVLTHTDFSGTSYQTADYQSDTAGVYPDSLKGMLKGNTAVETVSLDIDLKTTDPEGNSHYVTSMSEMFSGCTSLKNVTIKSENFDHVTSFAGMFDGCDNIENITLEAVGGKGNIDISKLFRNLPKLKSVTLKNFNITDASSAFEGVATQVSLDLSDSRITGSAENMFKGCTWVTSLPLSDHSSITNTEGMYQNTGLTGSVSISDLSSSTSAKNMFSGCDDGITSLVIDNAANVTDVSGMIDGISTLQTISLTKFDNAPFFDGFLSDNVGTLESITIEANLSELSTFRSVLTGNGTAANTKVTTLQLNNKATNGASNIGSEVDMFNGWTNLQTVKLENFKNSTAVSFSNLFRGNKNSLSYVRITGCKVNKISEMFRQTFQNNAPTTLSLELDLSEVTASGGLFQDSNTVTNDQIIEIISGCSFSSDNSLINNGGMNIWKNLGSTGKWYKCANGWVYVYTYLIKAYDPSETEPTYTP